MKVGGDPSGRMTERILRQQDAADVTHVGSECELNLKIPGTALHYYIIYLFNGNAELQCKIYTTFAQGY